MNCTDCIMLIPKYNIILVPTMQESLIKTWYLIKKNLYNIIAIKLREIFQRFRMKKFNFFYCKVMKLKMNY